MQTFSELSDQLRYTDPTPEKRRLFEAGRAAVARFADEVMGALEQAQHDAAPGVLFARIAPAIDDLCGALAPALPFPHPTAEAVVNAISDVRMLASRAVGGAVPGGAVLRPYDYGNDLPAALRHLDIAVARAIHAQP